MLFAKQHSIQNIHKFISTETKVSIKCIHFDVAIHYQCSLADDSLTTQSSKTVLFNGHCDTLHIILEILPGH